METGDRPQCTKRKDPCNSDFLPRSHLQHPDHGPWHADDYKIDDHIRYRSTKEHREVTIAFTGLSVECCPNLREWVTFEKCREKEGDAPN